MMRHDLKLLLDVAAEAHQGLLSELERHPNWADLHHLLALWHLAQGQLSEARSAAERALGVNPEYAGARGTRAYLLLRLGRPGEARQAFEELGSADLQGTAGRWGLGLVDLHEGNLDGAAAHLEACIALNGRLPWRHRLGVVRERQGRHDEAVALWRECAADPTLAPLYSGAGLTASGPLTPGVRERLMELVPDHPGVADLEDLFGRILARNRQWSDAEEAYRRAYAAEGVPVRYHVRQGFLAALRGQDQRSLAAYEKAVAVDPEWAPARVALAFEYSAHGDIRRATEQFEEAARLRPRWADVQYNLGLLHAAEGRTEEARERFLGALAINPGYAHAQASLAFSSYRLGRTEDARYEFERAIELGVRSADLMVHLALCHRDLGNIDQALRSLRDATEIDPEDEMAHYHLGVIHHQMGSRRKAQAAWRHFLDRAQQGPLYDEVAAQLKNGTDDD